MEFIWFVPVNLLTWWSSIAIEGIFTSICIIIDKMKQAWLN